MRCRIVALGALLVMAGSPMAGEGQLHDLGVGTIRTPDVYVLTRGGTDSTMGRLTRRRDGFKVEFDIGGLAGTHVHRGMRDRCSDYREFRIDGHAAATCVEIDAGYRRVSTTVATSHRMSPANFRATCRDDADLVEYERIVASYRERREPGPVSGGG